VLDGLLRQGVNVVRTSSAGRLFDAVASLLGVCQVMRHEGQAAMRLEALAREGEAEPYPFRWEGPELDWAPMIQALLEAREPAAVAAARFHATLAAMMAAAAQREGLHDVCLSGGCFQNRRLLAAAQTRLGAAGFRVWRHRDLPPNDAGIWLGTVGRGRGPRRTAPLRDGARGILSWSDGRGLPSGKRHGVIPGNSGTPEEMQE
jgi:hydrogenase maturation protein HypF